MSNLDDEGNGDDVEHVKNQDDNKHIKDDYDDDDHVLCRLLGCDDEDDFDLLEHFGAARHPFRAGKSNILSFALESNLQRWRQSCTPVGREARDCCNGISILSWASDFGCLVQPWQW